jgi:iron complex outermembrane receptor protein
MYRQGGIHQWIVIVAAMAALPVVAHGQAQTNSSSNAPASAADQAGSGTGGSVTAAAGPADQLQEVTVTATRVALDVQRVPMSIQAITSNQLTARNAVSVRDVAASVPNVNIGGAAGGGTDQPILSIRGIRGAGLFIDGIYQYINFNAADAADSGALELDRVEVLRGPQGTLFGENTTSGAIRLWTKLPAKTFGVRVVATGGSYNRRDITLNADIPLTSTLFSKLTYANLNTDGYIQSITVNRAYGGRGNQEYRLDFLWQPVSGFSARLTGTRQNETGSMADYTGLILDSSPPGTPVVPGFGWQVPNHEYYRLIGLPPLDCKHNVPGCPGGQLKDLQTTANFMGPGILATTDQYDLTVNWDISKTISLTSLGSYVDGTNWAYENFSNSDIPFFSQGTWSWQHALTEELQLTGNEGRIHWLGGAYLWHDAEMNHFMRWAFWDFQQPMNPTAPHNFSLVTSSANCQAWVPTSGLIPCVQQPASSETLGGNSNQGWSLFGQFGFDITRTLTATVGFRYQDEMDSNWQNLFGPGTARQSLIPGELPANTGALLTSDGRSNELSFRFTKPTYHFALNEQFTPTFMGYFNFSQGYNAGGDNRVNLPEIDPSTGQPFFYDKAYSPETIDDYEIGFKSQWLNRRLQVNADYFDMEWNDIQVQGTVVDPFTGIELPTYLTQNEAKARVTGVELDLQALITESLQVNFSMGTLDPRYIQVNPGAEIALNSRFGQAPKLQYSLGVQWTSPTIANRFQFVVHANDNYTSGFERTYIPGDQETTYTGRWDQEPYALVNARLTFEPVDNDKWELSVFGTNLTDRRYSTGGFFSPLLQVDDETIGPPREFGASIKFNL